jgi:hypothetical protein
MFWWDAMIDRHRRLVCPPSFGRSSRPRYPYLKQNKWLKFIRGRGGNKQRPAAPMLAKRRRRKGWRGSQPSRRCPTQERLAIETAGKSSGGGGCEARREIKGRNQPFWMWSPTSGYLHVFSLCPVRPGAGTASRRRTTYWVAPGEKGLWDAQPGPIKYPTQIKKIRGRFGRRD